MLFVCMLQASEMPWDKVDEIAEIMVPVLLPKDRHVWEVAPDVFGPVKCEGYDDVAALADAAYPAWLGDANEYKQEKSHEPRAQEILHIALLGGVHTVIPTVLDPKGTFYRQSDSDGGSLGRRIAKMRLVRNRLPTKESTSDVDACIEIDGYVFCGYVDWGPSVLVPVCCCCVSSALLSFTPTHAQVVHTLRAKSAHLRPKQQGRELVPGRRGGWGVRINGLEEPRSTTGDPNGRHGEGLGEHCAHRHA